jgi:hypothetical protein
MEVVRVQRLRGSVMRRPGMRERSAGVWAGAGSAGVSNRDGDRGIGAAAGVTAAFRGGPFSDQPRTDDPAASVFDAVLDRRSPGR